MDARQQARFEERLGRCLKDARIAEDLLDGQGVCEGDQTRATESGKRIGADASASMIQLATDLLCAAGHTREKVMNAW